MNWGHSGDGLPLEFRRSRRSGRAPLAISWSRNRDETGVDLHVIHPFLELLAL